MLKSFRSYWKGEKERNIRGAVNNEESGYVIEWGRAQSLARGCCSALLPCNPLPGNGYRETTNARRLEQQLEVPLGHCLAPQWAPPPTNNCQ